MSTVRLAPAARLALDASPPGVAAPKDDTVDVAWLDLSRQATDVAAGVVWRVVAALAPRLSLQSELRLVVAAGELGPKRAARAVAEVLDDVLAESTAIGVVRGESLLDRLEELALAGADLRESPGGGRLLDEPAPPTAVWAPTGAGPIAETAAAGARVVLTQAADVGTMAIAAAAEAFAWPMDDLRRYATAAAAARLAAWSDTPWIDLSENGSIDFAILPESFEDEIVLPDLRCVAKADAAKGLVVSSVEPGAATRSVTATIPVGWRKKTSLGVIDDTRIDRLVEQVWSVANDFVAGDLVVESTSTGAGQRVELCFTAKQQSDVEAFAARLELLLVGNQSVESPPRPLAESIEPRSREWRTSVPGELLQYGVDVRPAAEWLGD